MGQKFKAERSLRDYMKMVKSAKWAAKSECKKSALSGECGLREGVNSSQGVPLLLFSIKYSFRGALKDPMTFPLVLLNTLYPVIPPTTNKFLMGVQ